MPLTPAPSRLRVLVVAFERQGLDLEQDDAARRDLLERIPRPFEEALGEVRAIEQFLVERIDRHSQRSFQLPKSRAARCAIACRASSERSWG